METVRMSAIRKLLRNALWLTSVLCSRQGATYAAQHRFRQIDRHYAVREGLSWRPDILRIRPRMASRFGPRSLGLFRGGGRRVCPAVPLSTSSVRPIPQG
jgi:hypothetical protein